MFTSPFQYRPRMLSSSFPGCTLTAVPLSGRGVELGLHLTQCDRGQGLPPYQVASLFLIHPAVWAQQTWPKMGLGAVPLWGPESPSNTMSLGTRYTSLPSGTFIHPPFGHNTHGPRIRAAVPSFFLGELGPHLTQCGWGRGQPPRQVSSRSIQLFGYNTPTSQIDRQDTTGQTRQTDEWCGGISRTVFGRPFVQEGQHPLTGQLATNFRRDLEAT